MPREVISLDAVYANTLGSFRAIINSTAGEQYPESFFDDLFPTKSGKPNESIISQLGYYGEISVAAIKARVVPGGKNEPFGAYIEVLSVLPAYRKKGLGTRLLQYLEEKAKEGRYPEIFVTVFAQDEEALEWYHRHGYTKAESGAANNKEAGPASAVYELRKKI